MSKTSGFILWVVCVAFSGVTLARAADLNRLVTLDIEAQSLEKALLVFSQQADIQVVLNAGPVGSAAAPAVKGTVSAREGLGRLLSGTGFRFVPIGEQTVSVMRDGVNSTDELGSQGRSGWNLLDCAGLSSDKLDSSTLTNKTSSDSTSNGWTGSKGEDRCKSSENQRNLVLARVEGLKSVQPNDGDSNFLTDKNKIQEIVVTAQKRKERTIDVPMSITAISGENLEAAGIKNALDLSFAVPSLSVTEIGPGRQIIALRGIAGIRGTSSLTGMYLDEMPITGAQDGGVAAYIDVRTIDLDRVEVLKGPQGTLFGEGAAGGVIRFITKDPDLSGVGGSISTDFLNTVDGGWSESITGVLNLPLVTDVFGIRVAASYEDISGWIDQPGGVLPPNATCAIVCLGTPPGPIGNPSVGRQNINDSEVKHVRIKALYAPTESFRIKGLAEIHRNEGGASNIVNYGNFKDGSFIQAFDRNGPTDYTDDYDMFNLTGTYDFGFAQLLSSTSHAQLSSVQSFTQIVDGEPAPFPPYLEILSPTDDQSLKIVSQELRLTSASEGPFNWTFGGSYKDEKLSVVDTSGTDILVFGGALVVPGSSAGNRGSQASESWAAFGDVSYEFFDRIEIGGGLRYFSDQREATSQPLGQPESSVSAEFSKTTYRAFIKYAVAQGANVYFNVGSGFRSGGIISQRLRDLGAPDGSEPENTVFYELGAKASLLNGKIRLAGAAFYGEYEDMFADKQFVSPINSTLQQYTANGQDAEVRGVEWDIGWVVTDRLTLALSGDRTKTKITHLAADNVNPVYFVGDPISLVPKYTASVTADYRFTWSDSIPGFVQLDFNRKGRSYWTERANSVQIERQNIAPAVSFLNASLGAEWNTWRFNVVGRNLLNERDPINASLSGWRAQARPRTFGVGVSKSF